MLWYKSEGVTPPISRKKAKKAPNIDWVGVGVGVGVGAGVGVGPNPNPNPNYYNKYEIIMILRFL